MRKIICVILMLALVLGLSLNISATPSSSLITTTATGYTSAEDVVYVTYTQSGKTVIANWGARGEDCVFLSSYAEDYYTGSYTWDSMSTLSGSTSTSSVPSSDLYLQLQALMEDTHTFYTYYDGNKNVRDYYCYTDCVSSDITQVALLYRGGLKTSEWNQGSIWNQEHVWPKSKLSTSQQIGDIMHLRPANPSENSSRGNKAYGESSGYYDPGVSVRGDCARMVLYMYVRWGVTDTMWGSSGVMESLDILLEWMEEDPVDTWEMGRNDSVQSVTGTRNVFVDYPEYAWLLFGQEVPEDLVTPSGSATASECTHSELTVSDTQPATCTADGYIVYTCSCGETFTEAIPATGHSHSAAVTAPTCTQQGYTTHTCHCGHSYTDSYTDALGHSYVDGSCTRCGAAEPDQTLLGDANGDGVINHLDAMLIAQYYVGAIGEDDIVLAVADVNGDGAINHLDAMMVAQLYVGAIDQLG